MDGLDITLGLLSIITALWLLSGVHGLYVGGTDYDYKYEIKTESINIANNESVVSYDNLTEGEQKILRKAFKNNDNFLDGGEDDIYLDIPAKNQTDSTGNLTIINSIQAVEMRGAAMLVTIEGPRKMTSSEDVFEFFLMIAGSLFAILLILKGIDLIDQGIATNSIK